MIFSPGFEAVCCFFDVGGKEFVREPFPALLNVGLDAIPHTEECRATFVKFLGIQGFVTNADSGVTVTVLVFVGLDSR